MLSKQASPQDASEAKRTNDHGTTKELGALKRRKIDQAANSEGINRQSHSACLNELPLEIIHEIIWELDPVDLLYLTWTCKIWYATLMDKSARCIWETVCIGLPPFFVLLLTTCKPYRPLKDLRCCRKTPLHPMLVMSVSFNISGSCLYGNVRCVNVGPLIFMLLD